MAAIPPYRSPDDWGNEVPVAEISPQQDEVMLERLADAARAWKAYVDALYGAGGAFEVGESVDPERP